MSKPVQDRTHKKSLEGRNRPPRVATHPNRENRRLGAMERVTNGPWDAADQLKRLVDRGHGHCKEAMFLRGLL